MALIPRLILLLVAVTNSERMMVHDAADYVHPAKNVAEGNGFSQQLEAPYTPDTRRTPLYPTIIIISMKIGGESWPTVLALFQILFNLITIFLLYLVALRYCTDEQALWTSCLLGLSISHICYSVLVMADVLLALLVMSATYFLIRYRELPSWPGAILIGLSVGLAILARPVAIMLPLIITPFMIFGNKGSRKKGLAQGLLMSVIALMLVFPWMLRNEAILGEMTVSSVPSRNLLVYNAAMVTAYQENRAPEDVQWEYEQEVLNDLEAEGQLDNLALMFKTFEERGKEIIYDNLPLYLYLHIKSSLTSFFPNTHDVFELFGQTEGKRGTLSVLQQQGLRAAFSHYIQDKFWLVPLMIPFILILGATYILGLIGLIDLLKRDKWLFWFMLILAGYFLFITGPVSVPRFRIPVQAHLCLLAIIGWPIFSKWWKERNA